METATNSQKQTGKRERERERERERVHLSFTSYMQIVKHITRGITNVILQRILLERPLLFSDQYYMS